LSYLPKGKNGLEPLTRGSSVKKIRL